MRYVLRENLDRKHVADRNTLIVEELGLCRGTARVDIAVVNGQLSGYEIKSDRDTLSRLPAQMATYSRVFDTMTAVVAERHLGSTKAIIPDWWGVQVVAAVDSLPHLRLVIERPEAGSIGWRRQRKQRGGS